MIGFLEGCMLHGIFHGDLHGGNLLVLADGRTGLLDFGITGRLGEQRRLAFLRLLVGASMNDVRTPARGAPRPRRAPARHRPRRGHRRPRPRPAAGRPDHAHRRGAHRRDPAGGEGAARLRRPHAQGADAVRQEHGVPRRRHRHAGPRPRPVRRDRRHRHVLRHAATASASPPRSGSTTASWELDTHRHAGAAFGVDPDDHRRGSPTASSRTRRDRSSASGCSKRRPPAPPTLGPGRPDRH